MRRQRTLTILTGLLALTLVAGCSGDAEDGSATPAPPPSTTAPAPAEPTTASASPEEDDPDASEDDAADEATSDAPEDTPEPAPSATDEEPPATTDPGDPGGGGSPDVPSTDPPADGLAVPEGSGCTPGEGALPDGQWYGEVSDADSAGVLFDLMCFFLGEEADKAALEDGEVMVPVPNGYYVRNEDPTPRTFDVAGDAQVLHYPTGDPATTQLLDYPEWARRVTNGQVSLLGVWLTVDAGAVVAIEEQWTP